MIREERIKLIKHLKYSRSIGADYLITDKDADEIIKVLEQQPCEDAISREAVINKIANTCFWLSADNWEELIKCINSISPISTRPTGQWFIDERPESNREVVCSNCDQPVFKYHKLDFDYRPKYCPNCGTRMAESEDKNVVM